MSADFIKMIVDLKNERYLNQMKNLIGNKIPCGVFFDFNVAGNVSEIIGQLKNIGVNLTCACFIDNQVKESVEYPGGGGDIEFITLEEFANLNPRPQCMLFMESLITPVFGNYFSRYSVDMLTLINPDGAEGFYNFYVQYLPDLYEVHEMLVDEESKKVFRAYVKGIITKRVKDFRFAPESQYFLEGFLPVEGDIAIDGGAYDGATSRDFAMQGAKVYAFEMDKKNYENCLARADKYNFTVENLGLSKQEGEEFYSQGGTGSRKGIGELVGKFIDLDTYVLEKNLPRVDYIKLDIEGAELDMLHGAAKTISRWKPKMAVSAYHKPEDLWTLAKYIKSIRSDYKFYFRHYKIDCTDYILSDMQKAVLKSFDLDYFLPTNCECVLYCK